jgi:outer membrane protein TolC
MNTNLKTLPVIVQLTIFPAVLAGQTVYTLEEAIRTAVRLNNELAVARLEMEKADQQLREAVGNAMPSVTFDARYTRALKKPVFFLPDFDDPNSGTVTPIKIGSDNSVEIGFTATQVLFNSAVFTGVGTAATYEKASHENFRAVYNRTVTNTKRAYAAAQLSRHVLEMTRASLQNAEDNLRNVQVLNRRGIVSDYDLLRAEVRVENTRPLVLEAEKNALVALNTLKIAMGLDAADSVGVSGELQWIPADSSWLVSAKSVERNASLQALGYERTVGEKIVTIMRSEYLPTLSAFGNYLWQAQKNSLSIGSNDFVGSSQVGLALSVNLFNGFQTTSRVGQARADRRKTEERIEQLRETLHTQFQTIKLRLEEAQRRIRSQERTVDLAERTYAIATTRYRTGSGTQLEVNDADVALLQARLNRIQAVYDYAMALTDLEELLSIHQPQED